MAKSQKTNNSNVVKYNRWGYYFLIPFILVYLVFQLIPLVSTVYNSFFENYRSGLAQIGPNFVGLDNYIKLFSFFCYSLNIHILKHKNVISDY